MGSKPKQKIFLDICEESKHSFYEKRKQKIYKSWKGRFVFQTTGHRMLERVLKKYNMKDKVLDILRVKTKSGKIVGGKNPYFEDDQQGFHLFYQLKQLLLLLEPQKLKNKELHKILKQLDEIEQTQDPQ